MTSEELRDCTLVTKNGTRIMVSIESIEYSEDAYHRFQGFITGSKESKPKLSYEDYCREDLELLRIVYHNMLNSKNYIPEIKNVIFNDPATIVFWNDGTKTVVKCQPGDSFDPEKGLAMAITKKAYGNKGSYCNKLQKWVPRKTVSIDEWITSENPFSQLKKSILESMTKAFSDSPKPKKPDCEDKKYNPVQKAYDILVEARDGKGAIDNIDIDELIGYLGEALD